MNAHNEEIHIVTKCVLIDHKIFSTRLTWHNSSGIIVLKNEKKEDTWYSALSISAESSYIFTCSGIIWHRTIKYMSCKASLYINILHCSLLHGTLHFMALCQCPYTWINMIY